MAVPQHGTTSLPALARHHGVLLPHSSKELTRALASPSVTRDLSASRGPEVAIGAETMQVTSENQQLGGAPAVALVRDDDGHHVELVHHARPSILVHPSSTRLASNQTSDAPIVDGQKPTKCPKGHRDLINNLGVCF